MPHPSTKILASKSTYLEGNTILLGVTGSVAAFTAPMIARELMRHGATVIPVMSEAALTLIGKDLMWWATGNEPITTITGETEHIRYAGVMNKPVDMFLIAPCTLNSLHKIAHGISDTPITLIASTLLGANIPIVISHVGHEALVNNPLTQQSIDTLKDLGVTFLYPRLEEGKAKIPSPEEITAHVIRMLTENPLSKTKILITSGPTRAYIDDVRFITNSSSGKTGLSLAKQAWFLGGTPLLVLGTTPISPLPQIKTYRVTTNTEMHEAVMKLIEMEHPDIIILAAAMTDFTVMKLPGKASSAKDLTLHLKPSEKLIDKIREKAPHAIIIIYKAEWGINKKELIKRSQKRLHEVHADFVVANDLSEPGAGFGTTTNHVFITDSHQRTIELTGTKDDIARSLLNMAKARLQEKQA